MTQLLDHLAALTNAKTDNELWNYHVGLMKSYGFDRVLYGYTRYRTTHGLGDPQDWVILTNHGPEFMESFFTDTHYDHAPMLRWALNNNGACSWRWMEELAQTGNLTPGEMNVLQINQKHEVTAGYTISFRSVSERSKGAIGLVGSPRMNQDQVEEVWAKHGDELIVLNNIFHLKLLTLPYSGARPLTKRQREVLQWVGDGKTTQDIAILLELTPATVEKHLRLAREALDVETTAQAVLKAAFYNQMFVLEDVDN
ncbi:LuxR family transcriptional regulator [Yoonia sp. R2331]|uniref:LuxR family transcriptional regulator n=1 Tax=Yoonia sp. R2331 TaxID=3237238 RepID=UPI0034E5980A